MKTLSMLLLLLCLVTICAEELPKFDVLHVGTKTYRAVKVTAVEPGGIRFTHESGAARVKFEELETEIRSKFTFDPAEAKKFDQEREIQRLEGVKAAMDAKSEQKMRGDAKKILTHIEGKVQQVLKDGLLLSEVSWMEPGYKHRLDGAKVICSPKGHADGEWIEADVYPAGTYSYTTVLGAKRTVQLYVFGEETYLSRRKGK